MHGFPFILVQPHPDDTNSVTNCSSCSSVGRNVIETLFVPRLCTASKTRVSVFTTPGKSPSSSPSSLSSVGRTVTDVLLASVDSSQTASGTCASVFTILGNSLLAVALSLVSMLLVAMSSLVSTLAVTSCLSEPMVSACCEIISMLW